MPIHYDPMSREISSRKSLSSFSDHIKSIEEDGVSQVFFNTRFVQDNEHSLAFFKKVCKKIGNFKNKEIEEMANKLKNTLTDDSHIKGKIYYFEGEKMYEVLISNPICKKICERQRYYNWDDIIMRFC